MNNQEAITLLRNLEDSLDSYCGLNEEGKTVFRMAIEALSCSEIPNNSDTISRQAVKDIFTELYNISAIGSVFDKCEWTDICETTANELPLVQPEPAIPLSWIENHIVYLKSLDNTFSTLTATQISTMIKKWKDKQNENN